MTLPPPYEPGPPDPAAPYWGPVRSAQAPVPPALRPVNGFAIASLVLSLVCLAPLGLALGIVALVRISRRGERGRGLAVAGVAVSGVLLALALAMATGALNFSVWTAGSSAGTDRANEQGKGVFALQVGDCFTPGTEPTRENQGQLKDVTAEPLPCDGPHRGEVYGTFELAGRDTFPGTAEVMTTSRERCGALLFDYAPDFVAYGRLQTFFYYPDQVGWARGGRTVLCWTGRPQGNLEESIHKDESDFEPAQYTYLSAFRSLFEAQARVPSQGPDEDLAKASDWAGQMGAAYAESARLLTEARGGLPGGVRAPTGELAAIFEARVPHWEQASQAADARAFGAAVQRAEDDAVAVKGLDERIRAGLGLPVPEGGRAGADGGV